MLCIERGYVRREDEAADIRNRVHVVTVTGDEAGRNQPPRISTALASQRNRRGLMRTSDATALPDRLMIELTAYHSLALRDALANNPGIAFLAMLHALTLRLFYHYTTDTCLQVEAKDTLTSPFPGLADFPASTAIAARHRAWEEALPDKPEDLWAALQSLDADNREALFAHCAGLTINAVFEPDYRASRRSAAMRFQLAEALKLDMTQAGWVTRADNYLSRVTKSQIVAAVQRSQRREDRGAARRSQEEGDGDRGRAAADRHRLAAGTAARAAAPLDEAPAAALPAFLDEEEALQAA